MLYPFFIKQENSPSCIFFLSFSFFIILRPVNCTSILSICQAGNSSGRSLFPFAYAMRPGAAQMRGRKMEIKAAILCQKQIRRALPLT